MEVLADIAAASPTGVAATERVVVAVRQGQLLGTAFHPEITADLRWHKLFIGMCEENGAKAGVAPGRTAAEAGCLPLTIPAPLPVF